MTQAPDPAVHAQEGRKRALRGYRADRRNMLLRLRQGRSGSACMNKSELAERLAGRTGSSKAAAKDAVDGVCDLISESLANGEDVRIFGFGTFGTRERPARTARNPRTGENVSVAASTVPVFKPGRSLRNTVRGRAS